MSRNLVPKFILILILVALAVLALYPPSKTLKPGIDLAGGTSLIYAINTEGLSADEERDLAQKMIQSCGGVSTRPTSRTSSGGPWATRGSRFRCLWPARRPRTSGMNTRRR